jgi:hypothetical protein
VLEHVAPQHNVEVKMNVWITESLKLVKLMLGNPASTVELVVLICVGVVTFIIALAKIADLLGAHSATRPRSAIVFVLSVILLLGIAAAADIYLPQKLGGSMHKFIPLAAAIVALLVAVTPITCLVKKASYMTSLFSLVLAGASAAVVIALAVAAFNALESGNKGLDSTRERKDSLDKIMQ